MSAVGEYCQYCGAAQDAVRMFRADNGKYVFECGECEGEIGVGATRAEAVLDYEASLVSHPSEAEDFDHRQAAIDRADGYADYKYDEQKDRELEDE